MPPGAARVRDPDSANQMAEPAETDDEAAVGDPAWTKARSGTGRARLVIEQWMRPTGDVSGCHDSRDRLE
jgi:hypothetical protein